MRRAFLIAFFAGPIPYFLWTTAVLRTSHPDVIALTLGTFLLTIPWIWYLQRFARRPMFLLCWFATLGLLFWTAIRQALVHSESFGAGAGTLLLFPITGIASMLQDRLLLVPIGLFLWGAISGFVGILRRSAPPKWEREEPEPTTSKEEEDEGPEPPRPEPYVVPRPPAKPKGPAYTPPKRETPPPKPKRVPGA